MAEIRGYVVKVLNSEEVLFNRGRESGVERDMIFAVVDSATQNVIDPISGENLGSLDRKKAQFVVTQVGDRMSLGRAWGRSAGISTAALVMSGTQPTPSSGPWRERVEVADEVVWTGRRRVTKPSQKPSGGTSG